MSLFRFHWGSFGSLCGMRAIAILLLKWSVIFLQSSTSTGYFSNWTGSFNCRISPIIVIDEPFTWVERNSRFKLIKTPGNPPVVLETSMKSCCGGEWFILPCEFLHKLTLLCYHFFVALSEEATWLGYSEARSEKRALVGVFISFLSWNYMLWSLNESMS